MAKRADIPTYVFIGIDYGDPTELVQVARVKLVDIIEWCRENPALRRYFPVTVTSPSNTPVFAVSKEYGMEWSPVQAGSVNNPA